MRVWIDLANSPHPPLFRPIARRLEEQGAEVLITIRDHAQTRELAEQNWPAAEVIGSESPSGRGAKGRVLARRVAALAGWARRNRPDVALSHNSYAQITAARLAGVPIVTAMDYEHQPANHLAFRLAQRILVPEAVPVEAVARQGARSGKLVRYRGFKEHIYLADFEPDPEILASLGIPDAAGRRIVVVRAAPAGATYHRGDNPLSERIVSDLDASCDYLTVVLVRHPEQRRAIAALGLRDTVVPEAAVDARSLLCAADLFIGAGGTMTREAALLGTPTISIFAGREPAVDAELERQGLLTRLPQAGQPIAAFERRLERHRPEQPRSGRLENLRDAGERVIGEFVATTLDPALRPGGRQ